MHTPVNYKLSQSRGFLEEPTLILQGFDGISWAEVSKATGQSKWSWSAHGCAVKNGGLPSLCHFVAVFGRFQIAQGKWTWDWIRPLGYVERNGSISRFFSPLGEAIWSPSSEGLGLVKACWYCGSWSQFLPKEGQLLKERLKSLGYTASNLPEVGGISQVTCLLPQFGTCSRDFKSS